MSDLPPPTQSVRALVSIHALLAAGILILVLVTGGEPWQAVVVAGAYFVLAGGWSWLKAWRAARAAREQERQSAGREG
jgi:hypothetical protein